MAKSRNLKGVIDYTAQVYQKMVVLENCISTTGTKDMGRCFTCNTLVPRGRKTHGGHWKKRSNHSVLFERANCNLQCETCNIDQHGNMNIYEQKMIEKYGQAEHDRIVILARLPKKWTFDELDKMRKEYQDKIKILEAHR